ncbi:TetR/AcrR family transcriptional regulator [Nocardioides marmoriginsengisoli]|uniref:TetR/AcrR family transcriptional regulator n=1 Tax=Nocardioides marmoriginsengisoli TaxID=661483 RepID=A0A3N0CHV2_9ACTN|nr:helix-turn-helix domain-containing protein [Nocardioides marmoriginsengisoli]RNL62543.1 TetR/AcrR family transcriptional regulator [Nocardioides marmoriginsengisoli]
MSTPSTDWLTGGERHELAIARIRGAARDLLTERGLDKFTAEAVAARAGCSRATLYRHVGGKSALLAMVLADAASRVGDRVEEKLRGISGPERVVEAILVSVAAVRADRALAAWFGSRRNSFADDYLRGSAELTSVASALTGLPATDALGAQWVVRVVLMLLAWPAQDAATERALVTAYVAPAFGRA